MPALTPTLAHTVPRLDGLRERTILLGRRSRNPHPVSSDPIAPLLADAGYRVTEVLDGPHDLEPDQLLFLRGTANHYPALCRQLELMTAAARPLLVVWQMEPLPPPRSARLPRPRLHAVEIKRIARRSPRATDVYSNHWRLRRLARHGLPDVLAASSLDGCEFLAERGIAAHHVPFGYHPVHGRDLGLERDIDVLFLGELAVPRRQRLLQSLRAQGVHVEAAGDWLEPDLWNDERTRLINRCKIFLNLQRYRGVLAGMRLVLGMANRALVVSEPFTNPAPYVPGVHFVSAPFEELPAVIEHYLAHDEERERIAGAGHELVTRELTLAGSLTRILELAAERAA